MSPRPRHHGPLFGLETEYGVAAARADRWVSPREAAWRLWSTAAAKVRFLPDESEYGMFTASGSRLYLDAQHLEYSAVETSHPDDAVRFSLAGDRLLERVLAEIPADERPVVFKSNVDYVSGTTWGAHESYLSTRHPQSINPGLEAHLVSRIVFSGGGGFADTSRGVRFALSPRAFFCVSADSDTRSTGRGITHGKQEPLANGRYQRIHVTCGENLLSQRALWLKVATTSLVVAMLDAGLQPGRWVMLRDPVGAFRSIAADPSLRVRVELTSGQTATAIDIQRDYLRYAESHVGDSFMPPWAAEACIAWRTVLDELEDDAPSIATSLDWAMRLSLFSRALAARGADLRAGLRTEATRPARRDLFALDLRFGMLGEGGLFREFDRAGLLTHTMPGVGDVDAAVDAPPASGRGRLRGLAVQRLAANEPAFRCDWQRITSLVNRGWLDLNDPFAESECWRGVSAARAYPTYEALVDDVPADWGLFARETFAQNAYQARRYEEARDVLHRLIAEGYQPASTHCHMARVLVVLGDLAGAATYADFAVQAPGRVPDHIHARVAWLRLLIAMLTGRPYEDELLAVKARFCSPRPLRDWAMGPVVELIERRLGAEPRAIVLALLRAGTGADALESLDRFTWWTSLRGDAGSEVMLGDSPGENPGLWPDLPDSGPGQSPQRR